MDFSRGVSNQEDKDKIHGSWIPIIPEKPIPRRPEQITDNRQANQSGITNQHESDRSVEFFQEIPSIFNGDAKYLDLMSSLDQSRGVSNWEAALAEKRCSNHIVGPYTPSLQNVTGGWNNNNPFAASASEMQRGSNNATGGPYSPISYTYSHIDNCWHQRNSENVTLVTQNYSNNESNPRNNNYCPSQINQYGFHVPYRSPPRGIADAVSNGTISFQFAPITPEKGERVDNNQSSKMVNVSVDERLIHDDINSKGNNALELQCKESFLQTVVDSSSGTIFNAPLEENRNPEKGEENGVGLNKTPEQKAKRKKHRPRVVREGKPKRTPKAPVGRTSTKETPAVKRKYVRKKVSNTPADIVREATDPAHTTAVKSCKRALNFNLEGQAADARHETLIHQEGMLHCNVDGSSSRLASSFNSESRARDLSTVVPKSSSGAKTTVQLPQGIEVMVENSQAGFAFDLNRATTQMLDDYISLPEKPAPTTPPPTRKDPPREAPGHQHIHAVGIGDALCTGNSYTNNENAVPSMLQNSVQLISESQDNSNCSQHYKVADGEQAKGPKRGYCHTTETDERQLQSMNMMRANLNSMLVYQAICRENGYHGNNSNLDPHFPEIYKKRRTEKYKNAVLLSTSSGMANVGDDAGKATAQSENNANADHFASQANNNGSASQFNNADGTKNLNHGASYSDIYSQSEAAGPNRQGQGIPAEMLSHKEALSRASLGIPQASNFIQTFGQTERKTKRRSKGPTRVHNLASPTANAEHNTCPSTPMKMATSGDRQGIEIFHGPQACVEALAAVDNHAKMAKKKRSKKLSIDTSVAYLCTDKVNLQENETPVYIYQQALAKSRGPSKVAWPFNAHIEEIIQRFNRLNINGESNKILVEEQNALVPFGGHGQMIPFAGNGQMVLFEGQFYPIKKRKPRPKVDLDPESERVWKLLMGKESINDVEGTDEDKEKWWEEERRVFRGRADSFIARMHLIQGDRRFTHWKGSVLDSVVGVFLTQNVSDHLSSSAYMSLAAKFPLKPQSNNKNGTNMYVEEPEECILDSNDTIKWHKDISREPVGDQSSVSFQEAEHVEERQMSNSHESFGSNTGGGSSPDISKSMQLDICESGQKMCHELTQNRTDNMTTGEGCKSFSEVENVALEDLGSSPSSDVSSQNSEDSILQKDDRTVIPKMGSANPIDTLDMRALNDASLNSSNSSTLQTSVRIRSCSDSSSEPEDPTKSCKPNILNASFTELLQMAGATMSQEFYNNTSDSPSLNLNSKNGHNQSEDTETGKRSNLETINGLKDLLSIHPSISQTTLMGVPIIPSSNDYLQVTPNSGALGVECPDVLGGESRFSLPSIASGITEIRDVDCTSKRTGQVAASASETTAQQKLPSSAQAAPTANTYSSSSNQTVPLLINLGHEACSAKQPLPQKTKSTIQEADSNLPNFPGETLHVVESMSSVEKQKSVENKGAEPNLTEQVHSSEKASHGTTTNTSTSKAKLEREKKKAIDWDNLRKVYSNGAKRERSNDKMDSVDWEAVRCADVHKIAETIKERGMNNMLAERIKGFLNRIVTDHGSIDLEWLRDVPPDKAKEYLLSVRGLGLKSVECVRLLTLHHLAFPVDTNVGRIAVRLGWVPLQPLPESLQLHLLELYPMQETIQKYLWPRLCTLDQRTLYELHYQMITFGKVFCTKSKPNCNACPMRAECKHFASAFASARLALPGPEEKGIVSSTVPTATNQNPAVNINPMPLPQLEANQISEERPKINKSEPLIEQPATPEPESIEMLENDIEDALYEDPDEIPTISLNIEEFALNLQNYMQENMELQEGDMSKALIALTPEATSIPMPKLKNMSRLRTEHQVYELPDSHPLLKGVDRRVAGDICSYLLAIWTPGETAESTQPPERCCSSQISGDLCNEKTCFSCSSIREANSQTVRGTLLIPCKTAMKGSFPLNGTYFQVNEVFADHDSSLNPIDVPRAWIWNLPRRTVLFGTSIPTIFKGQSTEEIQSCFWKGYVCIRGFDQKTRAPRPLMARFHFPASKLVRSKTQTNQ